MSLTTIDRYRCDFCTMVAESPSPGMELRYSTYPTAPAGWYVLVHPDPALVSGHMCGGCFELAQRLIVTSLSAA